MIRRVLAALAIGLCLAAPAHASSHGITAPFGLMVAGPENYNAFYPTTADCAYIKSKGIKTVALTFAWENVQTTLGGSLATTPVNNLKSAISCFNAVGVGTIVRMQNYGFYAPSAMWGSTVTTAGNAGTFTAGMNYLGDGTITTSVFANVWSALATALTGTSGLIGYDIMNEPLSSGTNLYSNNLFCAPNYFGATSATTGSVCNWYTINTVNSITMGAYGSNPLNAAYSPAWVIGLGSFGAISQSFTMSNVAYTLSFYAWTNTGSAPFTLNIGGSNQCGVTVTTTPTRFTCTKTPPAGTDNVYFQLNQSTAVTVNVADAQFEQASSATAYNPNPWLPFAQAAINAIRAVDTSTAIYVQGWAFGYWGANWQDYNWDLASLTGGNLVFEDHLYFDGAPGIGDGGSYSSNYTAYSTNAQGGVLQAQSFVSWLQIIGAKGQVGEFGIPNSSADSNASWFPLQLAFLNYLYANGIPATQTFYGANSAGSGSTLYLNPVGGVDDPRLTQMIGVAP